MTDKPETAAHFAAYGLSADDIEDRLTDDELRRVTLALHNALDDVGLGGDIESVALVSGDRADELLSLDRTLW